MKKIRINNEMTTNSKSIIVTFSIACFVLFLLCMFFMYIYLTYGRYSDGNSKIDLILILGSLFISFILFLVFTVKTIVKRNNELRDNHKAKTIKYLEFSNEGITVCYSDNIMFKIVYNDVDEMKLKLKTEYDYGFWNFPMWYRYIAITGMNLLIKYNCKNVNKSVKINIPAGFTLIDKLFEIVHFSQYISDFSYESSVQHKEELQKTSGKAIESYKANNYRHTFRSFGYTMWALPVLIVTVIILFTALFLIGCLIATGII